MMRTIYLHGSLGKKYGKVFRFDVATAAEAVRALCANFPEIIHTFRADTWHIVRGKTIDNGMSLNEDQIAGFRLGKADLHVLPYIAGSKRSGILKAVVGIALIGVTFGFAGALTAPISSALFGATTWGNAIGMLGISLAVTGVSQLLAPQTNSGQTEEKNSFLLNGSTISAQEGTGIPIVYGEVITGGILISTAIDIDGTEGNNSVSVTPATTNSLGTFFGSNRVGR